MARRRGALIAVVLVASVMVLVGPAPAGAAPAFESYVAGLGTFQHQQMTVNGVGGTYRLVLDGVATAPLGVTAPACSRTLTGPPCDSDSVETALRAIGADVTVADGPQGTPAWGALYTFAFADADAHPLTVGARTPGPTGMLPQVDPQCVHCIDTASAPSSPNCAAVLFVHSGGLVLGNSGEAAALRPSLEAAGYRVFSLNYRLINIASMPLRNPILPGCSPGAPPPDPSCASWLAASELATADVNAAVTWMRSNAPSLGIDPARVAVIGFSEGGILALQNHYDPPAESGRSTTVVSLSGIMDEARVQPGAGPAFLLGFAGVDPMYADSFLTGIDAQTEIEQVASAAAAQGGVVSVRSYPGSGHTLTGANLTNAVAQSLAFMDRAFTNKTAQGGGSWLGTPAVGFKRRLGQAFAGAAGTTPVDGDFDGDGFDDILWYGPGDAADSMWWGGDDGVFHDPVEWSTTSTSYAPAVSMAGTYAPQVGDLDGDGRSDIVWHSPTDGQDLEIWYGNADRSFAKIAGGDWPAGIELRAGDLTGDGSDDALMYSSALQGMLVFATNGTRGSFTTAHLATGLPSGPAPTIVDVDGDGRADLFWSQMTTGNLWFSDGGSPAITFDKVDGPPATATDRVLAGDFDGDGRGDLHLTTGLAIGRVHHGDASRVLGAPVSGVAIDPTADAVVADVNGDGRAEVTFTRRLGPVSMVRPTGPSNWPAALMIGNAPIGQRPIAANINGDSTLGGIGIADIVWF